MADIALKTNIPGAGSIFDAGLNVPADPLARGKLGVAALAGVEPAFEQAIRAATNKSSISDVYGQILTQGIDALIERLAQGGVARDTARASLTTIEQLVSKAGSYPLFPTGSPAQFYVTEAGDLLTHPNEEPLAENGAKIDRLHGLALGLVSLAADPIETLPVKTRESLLTALAALKTDVLTPRAGGTQEVKESRPNLTIPDAGDWVSDTIDIAASGRLEKFSLDLDIAHPYIGDLTVELVAPDRTSIKLHDKQGGDADNIKKTFTLDSAGMRALEGKEVNGRWRIRLIDSANQDVGTLNSWKLDVTTRGSTGSVELYGEARKKALYAGAGAIGRRLASAGTAEFKTRAFDFTADLIKTSPYTDVRSIMIAGLNGSKDKLAAADRARLEKELIPLVAPETPDYDTIYQLQYGNANGRPTAQKRSLNFVVMYGSEEDDLIYNGGKEMIKAQGFVEAQSDKPGYELLVKKVNQNDPNAHCQEIRTYVAHMNGSNMMQAMGDADIDVIQYDGHSNLGRNIENSVRAAPELAGSKILSLGACATTDRAFLIRNKFGDPKSVQLINTYESTYFNWEVRNGKKYMNYSENMKLMFGLQEAMSQLKPYKGTNSIATVLERATESWQHSKDVNYTNPGLLEQLMLWDLDQNGLPDGGQQVWDGSRVKPDELIQAEFEPRQPAGDVNRLQGTKIFMATQSLDTFGRYNPITREAYEVRTIRAAGFVDLGREGPMVQVSRDAATRGWKVTGNSWYSHASVEAFRAELHHQFITATIKESGNRTVRDMSTADKNIMRLLFSGASLSYDNGFGDDRIWGNLLKKHGYPDVAWSDVETVLHWEHDQPGDELSGNFRDVPRVKDAIGAATYTALGNVAIA